MQGFPHGMLLHAGHNWTKESLKTLKMVYTLGTAERPIRLYMEPFTNVLKAIRESGWSPE